MSENFRHHRASCDGRRSPHQRTFGIFDSFGSDEARQAHLQGAVAAALLGRAEELLDGRPDIRPVDILAEKLPA
jgi:quinol monooxygenase YgiN